MKVCDYVASFIKEQQVSCVFELTGGMITYMLDSLHRQGGVRIVSMHHEQAAAFAAEAAARMTGTPGVALATSGPGATNLLTGIGSCYFDSIPTVFITGQVNRNELKGERPTRQLGFQETDIVSMAKPITKAAWQVEHPEEVPEALERAFSLAVSGRPGPVLIDIPMDVQRSEIPDQVPGFVCGRTAQPVDQAVLDEVFTAIQNARRPLILVGGGVKYAGRSGLLRQLVERTRIPVVHSLMAVDALPSSHPYRIGLIGSYGNRWANFAVGRSDMILVLGSRLDVRQTGAQTAVFKGDRVIFHVDCDAGEINNRVLGCRAVVADLHDFLDAAVSAAEGRAWVERPEWLAEIGAFRERFPDTRELAGVPGINPNEFMHQLSTASQVAAAYVIDVGQHQMWAAQSMEVGPNQRFLTSGGMGAMGFGLPTAIGAALSSPGQPVVAIAGDGSFQVNIQELQTVVRNRLPVKMVVMNNNALGMVRQFQQSYFDSRFQSTVLGYSAPDFEAVANGYGIAAFTVRNVEEVQAGLRWLWQDPSQPALLQVMIDSAAPAYPKLTFGKPLTEMDPPIDS